MSTHDGPGADPHEHAFDGEPVRALAADEPRTPGWLPALGAALFVVAAVWFLAMGKSDDASAAEAAASASASVAAAPSAAPVAPRGAAPQPDPGARPRNAAQAQVAPTAKPGTPGAAPPPSGAVHKYTPEELARLRKAIDERHGQ